MLDMTSTAGENLPKLWVEIALKKIKLIEKSKPLHLRLKVLNESMIYLEKHPKQTQRSFQSQKSGSIMLRRLQQNQFLKTWHSKQIDKALTETSSSNKQKAYEWSLVILFNTARKHQFKSARLNFEIALQYSKMSQMKQYASRKKEFLKEMEIFL